MKEDVVQEPMLFETKTTRPDTEVLVSYIPVPGFGVLPVNSFLIRSDEPVLIDTGLASLGEGWIEALGSSIDPADLRWIWLTHTDPDHVGNLVRILDAAPKARIVTTYLGMAKLSLLGYVVDRAFLLNPGQSLDVGDRKLLAVRPPTFDAPETTGVFDPSSRTLFSADSFGALMEAPTESANELDRAALSDGMKGWAMVDAPWLQWIDPVRFDGALREIRGLDPATVLSSHLPVAEGMVDTLLHELAGAREAPAFVGPDQAALEEMMAAPAIA